MKSAFNVDKLQENNGRKRRRSYMGLLYISKQAEKSRETEQKKLKCLPSEYLPVLPQVCFCWQNHTKDWRVLIFIVKSETAGDDISLSPLPFCLVTSHKPSQKILSDKEAKWVAASYKEVSLLWYIKSNISYLSNKIINAIRFLDSSSFQKLATQYPRVPLGWFKHKNSVVREEVRDNESVKQDVKYKWNNIPLIKLPHIYFVIKTHHIESDFL